MSAGWLADCFIRCSVIRVIYFIASLCSVSRVTLSSSVERASPALLAEIKLSRFKVNEFLFYLLQPSLCIQLPTRESSLPFCWVIADALPNQKKGGDVLAFVGFNFGYASWPICDQSLYSNDWLCSHLQTHPLVAVIIIIIFGSNSFSCECDLSWSLLGKLTLSTFQHWIFLIPFACCWWFLSPSHRHTNPTYLPLFTFVFISPVCLLGHSQWFAKFIVSFTLLAHSTQPWACWLIG